MDVEEVKITDNPSSSERDPVAKISNFRFQVPIATRNFAGRNPTMYAIQNYFAKLPQQPTDCWDRIVAIVGLGGMGKTETSYKFAAKYEKIYPNVARIDAETQDSLLQSFLDFAKVLKIASNDRVSGDVSLVKQVYRHIDQEDFGQVLFIFDSASRLNSSAEEFGIMEYLPTDDLINHRFPYILITSQAQDWDKANIKMFQIDQLTEGESLEFFLKAFPIESAQCDELFKKLHKLLEGYPLVMNLAASHIDFDPDKHSVSQLKQQIHSYIEKLEKMQELVSKRTYQALLTKRDKTLSSVWLLTFERINQESTNVLRLLYLMTFLQFPIHSDDVLKVWYRNSDCVDTAQKELQLKLKNDIHVLERIYYVSILKVHRDDDKGFSCHLGIHPVARLTARHEITSQLTLELVLMYFANNYKNDKIIDKAALEEQLKTSQLSQQAWSYVGILACRGFPAASEIVKKSQPKTKAATIIWRLFNLERGMTTLNADAIGVLSELIGLTKSEKLLEDRQLFADVTIDLLVHENHFLSTRFDGTEALPYFKLQSLDGVENLVAEFILSFRSIQDLNCNSDRYLFDRERRDNGLSVLTTMLSKTLIRPATYSFIAKSLFTLAGVAFCIFTPYVNDRVDKCFWSLSQSMEALDDPKPIVAVDVIADTWLTVIARMRFYDTDNESWPQFLFAFWDDMYTEFHWSDVSKSKIATLRTSLWNRGIAKDLIKMLDFFSRRCAKSFGSQFKSFLLKSMDVCMDGMDLRDERVQEVISSFAHMTTTIETEFISKNHRDAPDEWIDLSVELASVWFKLFLIDHDPTSDKLLESLSHLKFLDWMQKSQKLDRRIFRFSLVNVRQEYPSKYFPQFIKRFSSSDIKIVQKLVIVTQLLVAENK